MRFRVFSLKKSTAGALQYLIGRGAEKRQRLFMCCLRIGTSISTVNLKSYMAKVAHPITGKVRDDLNWYL